VLDRRTWLETLLILLTVAATGVLTASRVSAQSPDDRDFFGTVVSVADSLLLVATEDATVTVVITPDTRVRLPLKREAKITDLVQGDRVAVSLTDRNGRRVADKVFLVPDKPRYRHVPGMVVALSPGEITIQPPVANAEPIAFAASAATPVRLRHRVTTLAELSDPTNPVTGTLVGRFVVVSAVMRYDDLPQTLEILVPEDRPLLQTPAPSSSSFADGPVQRVEIRGVFTGLDAEGNWIIGGAKVKVDPQVAVDGGLAVGQPVEVEARVGPDGSFYASVIEREDPNPRIPQRLRLEGEFQGVDDQDRWVISGTQVAIGQRSNTDELPYLGQRVRILATRQEDGALLALTVENRSGTQEDLRGLVELRGVLESIDDQGKWTVSGIKVTVGAGTKLEGSPAVNQPVKVTAHRQEDGLLLARQIEGRDEEIVQQRGQAKLVGTVEEVRQDGSLVIDGVTVARSTLTELEGEPQVGNLVAVEAMLLENGTLLAREVHLGWEVEVLGLSAVRESQIGGSIERVNADGSLVVNGVTVVIGLLTDLEINLNQGALVKVKGVLQPDGSLRAWEVRGESRGGRMPPSKVTIAGRITEVDRDQDGDPKAVVVDEFRITLEAITHREGSLEEGDDVEIRGIVQDGQFLASRIERRKGANRAPPREFRLEGRIESLWLNERGRPAKFAVNGLIVDVLPTTKVKGTLKGGDLVEVDGVLRNGSVVAANVETRERHSAAARRSGFRLKAVATAAQVDPQGRLLRLTVEGRIVTVEDLTQIEPGVAVGRVVEVQGVVNGATYVATKISLADQPSDRQQERQENPDGKGGSGSSSK
jgi:hypothetical protein